MPFFKCHSLETWELSFTKANNYRVLGEPFGMLTSAPLGTNRIVLLPLTTTRFLSRILNAPPQNTTMCPISFNQPINVNLLAVVRSRIWWTSSFMSCFPYANDERFNFDHHTLATDTQFVNCSLRGVMLNCVLKSSSHISNISK